MNNTRNFLAMCFAAGLVTVFAVAAFVMPAQATALLSEFISDI